MESVQKCNPACTDDKLSQDHLTLLLSAGLLKCAGGFTLRSCVSFTVRTALTYYHLISPCGQSVMKHLLSPHPADSCCRVVFVYTWSMSASLAAECSTMLTSCLLTLYAFSACARQIALRGLIRVFIGWKPSLKMKTVKLWAMKPKQ